MTKNNKLSTVLRIIELVAVLAILTILLVPIIKDASNSHDGANKAMDPAKAQYWREAMWQYRDDDNVQQMLLVKCVGECDAIAEYYIKSDSNNAWELKFKDNAYIGRKGADGSKPVEGDEKTPFGDFAIGKTAFGILPNPGTKLEWIDVTPSTYACDEDCEYYNQIIDINKCDHKNCKGEEMYKYTPEYNYGFTMNHNPTNEYPNQSNIFIHCKGAKPYTGGCIALDQDHIETILKTCSPGMRIVINEIY